jgi:hypothetical protein
MKEQQRKMMMMMMIKLIIKNALKDPTIIRSNGSLPYSNKVGGKRSVWPSPEVES